MTGADKAAILLLYLGQEATKSVFEHMQDSEIAKISQSMSRLGHVSREEIAAVVHEFMDITNPDSGLFSQGQDMLKKMLEQTVGPARAQILLSVIQSADAANISEVLETMDSRVIANFFSQEHPQTIAVILAKLRPRHTAEILSLLPQELQAEVVIRVAEVDQVSPEILVEVDEVIRKELTALGGVQRFKVGGVEKVVDIISNLEPTRERKILEKLDNDKPSLAEVIRKYLFTFEDIFRMDDRAIQAIMREVKKEDLTLAMKNAKDEVKEKIFRNVSTRAAEMMKEDLAIMGPVRLSDVEKAQSEIVKVVKKMEEEGKVMIIGRGNEDVLV